MSLLRPSLKTRLLAIWQYEHDPYLERLLLPIGQAIAVCSAEIEEVSANEDPDYMNSIIDDEVQYIEDLLGTAFVVCQTNIANTVAAVKRLHKFCKENHAIVLTTTDGSKGGLMKLDHLVTGAGSITRIEIINTFANYFKHQDEWTGSWNLTTVQNI